MDRTRLIVLAVAVCGAGLAGYTFIQFLPEPPKPEVKKIEEKVKTEVLLVIKSVGMGEFLSSGSIGWQVWPDNAVTREMITKATNPDAISKFQETRARTDLYEGEPVNPKKLVVRGDSGFMAAVLPKGYRAIAVKISNSSGAGGFILPNDRVDVIMTRRLSKSQGKNEQIVAETVMSNVRVLAVNRTLNNSAKNNEESSVAQNMETATLELNENQAEVISMTETMGTLSLALRSISENEGKALKDIAPELSEKFKYGAGENEVTTIKSGVIGAYSSR